MGTNYYLHVNPCRCCKRPERILHIGKSSYGWHFQLRVHPGQGINDLSDWKPLFDKWPIIDEKGLPPTVKELSEVLGISHASAHEQIAQLVRKGYLKKEARKARSIVVIRRPE